MEEQIKKTVSNLRIVYFCFWLVPILLIIYGECGGSLVGFYADNMRVSYYAETLVILTTAVCVPVSLKLFAWVLTKKIDLASITDALKLSSTGALCAAISLTASLFCLPGEERLRQELHINKSME